MTVTGSGYRFTSTAGSDQLVAIKRYDADGGLPKWQSVTGSRAALFPDPQGIHDEPYVILVEGEWDALIGQQFGLPTYSPTHGAAGLPRAEWLPYFQDKHVAVIFDCDQPGRDGAKRWADWFLWNGVRCRVVDLRLGHKEDISDWFLNHCRGRGELLQLIGDADWYRG